MFMRRIYGLAVFITSIFVYIVWQTTSGIQIGFIENVYLRHALLCILDFILAYGFFECILNGVVLLMKNSIAVKKLLFGACYMEGVWIGHYYLQNSQEMILFIEQIEQDLTGTVISGRGYGLDFSYKGSWNSISTYINEQEGNMACMYKADMLDNNQSHTGISNFNFIRKNNRSAPTGLVGYSIEIDIPEKISCRERKISDLPNPYSDEALLESALAYYKERVEKERTPAL